MIKPAEPTPTNDAETAARAGASWEDIQAAAHGAGARCAESYAAIEAAHREAAARSAESWEILESGAKRKTDAEPRRSWWQRLWHPKSRS